MATPRWLIPAAYGAGFLAVLHPEVSSAVALGLGMVLSLGFDWKLPSWGKTLGKFSLQASIVLLGFAMDPQAVLRAGTQGVLVTALGLGGTLALGIWLGRRLGVTHILSTLIAVGTAICGGSAIAAVAPALKAESEDIAVALAVVFLLNAVALVIFPPLGSWVGLSPQGFGWLAAIAIHDTSSVVGAAARYDAGSLLPAVTIKLTRALWIVPMALGFAWSTRGEGKKTAAIPVFIPLFLLAVGVRAVFPAYVPAYGWAGWLGKCGLHGAIFLVSAQMSRAALKKAGVKPLALAVILWFAVTVVAITGIKSGWIGA